MASVALASCSSGSPLFDVSRAVVKQQFGSSDDPDASAALNPSLRYLRGNAQGYSSALLVLGYVDHHPQGDIEVWYSAKREMVKTQNGRIVGTSGLTTDWPSVRFTTVPPTWDSLKQHPHTITRVRDEMPGYRYGITDQLTLSWVTGVPPMALPASLPLDVAKSYAWVRESQSGAQDGLPDSWYALEHIHGQYQVAYSYQCLSKKLCLNLQRWPIQKATP